MRFSSLFSGSVMPLMYSVTVVGLRFYEVEKDPLPILQVAKLSSVSLLNSFQLLVRISEGN